MSQFMDHREDISPESPTGLSRRTVLKAGTGAALGLGIAKVGISAAQDSTPAVTEVATPADVCVLTAEQTEGPYYVARELVRSDITEGKAGVPVALRIAVTDVGTCAPLANAAVDIWHCDAQGYYSGITGENPGGGGETTGEENADTTFLRGVQITDENGIAEFSTIFPGWYTSRTCHIHMKVHVDGEVGAAANDADAAATPVGGETYQSGHVSHTGQLFFEDSLQELVFATEAYARANQDGHIFNESDNILGEHADEPGFIVTATQVNASNILDGITGIVTVGVDPTVTQTETGMGGSGNSGSGPGGPPDGTPPDGMGGPGVTGTPAT